MQDGGVAIFPVKGSAHQRPQDARNRRAIDNRTSRCDPDNAIRIGIMQFAQQRHLPAIVFTAAFDLSAVIPPRMFFASSDGIPRGRLTSTARRPSERENAITSSPLARYRSQISWCENAP